MMFTYLATKKYKNKGHPLSYNIRKTLFMNLFKFKSSIGKVKKLSMLKLNTLNSKLNLIDRPNNGKLKGDIQIFNGFLMYTLQ